MAMTNNQRTARTYSGAVVLTCVVAATYLLTTGIDDRSIDFALRVSGRVAFAVLIVVFVARPLQQLLKAPWTAKLLRNRRQLGVAFAGIHTAHLGLILMRVNHVEGFETADVVNLYGSFVYAIILVMLITSFDGPARAIGRKGWKGLHKTGLFVLFGGFLSSQLPKSLDQLDFANGVLVALAAVALVIRITAFLVRYRAKGQPQ